MALSGLGASLSPEIKNGTTNSTAVDAIALAILKAVDMKQSKASKDTSNMRKNIINALGYKPVEKNDMKEYVANYYNNNACSVPKGTYTIPLFIANGFISSSSSLIRVWIPMPLDGRTISIASGGTVTIRSQNGYLMPYANSTQSAMSSTEFSDCTITCNQGSAIGCYVSIKVPSGKWYVSNTDTAATNNVPVSVWFNTSLIITVS